MTTLGFVLCPNLRGSSEGIKCSITNKLIRDMDDVSPKFCMSRRHEACAIYMQSLQHMIECGSYTNCA